MRLFQVRSTFLNAPGPVSGRVGSCTAPRPGQWFQALHLVLKTKCSQQSSEKTGRMESDHLFCSGWSLSVERQKHRN